MNETEIRRAIDEALQGARVMDPHCHLEAGYPVATSLADVLLYHHVWIELVSAGMGQYETSLTGLPQESFEQGIEPAERVRRALPYLPRIRNSVACRMFRWILEDVYDFHEELTPANVDRLSDLVAARGREEGRLDRVLGEICGIDRCITLRWRRKTKVQRLEGGRETSQFISLAGGKHTPREGLAELDKMLGREVKSASDINDGVKKVLEWMRLEELRFLGIGLPGDITPQLADDREVARILGRVREGAAVSPDELGSVAFFGMTRYLELLRATPMRTIQVLTGVEVFPPHRSVTRWAPGFSDAMARIAGQFEDFHFNIGMASEVYIHDTAMLAKHFPNVSVAGYWWHTFYPQLVRKSLEIRLDSVPMGKIVGFFSDAYRAEWCYPKLKLVKQVLGDILTERVQRSWYSLDDARAIIRAILHDAPTDIYHMGG